jgi:sugar lactone lactonase YvrE
LPIGLHAQAPVFKYAQSVIFDGFEPIAVAADPAGDAFFLTDNRAFKVPAGGGLPVVIYDQLNNPLGIAADSHGNVYIADTDDNRVVAVPANGNAFDLIDTQTTQLKLPTGVAVDAAGNIYIANFGLLNVLKVAASGGPVTQVGSGWQGPSTVTADGLGNVFVIDDANGNGYPTLFKVPAGGGAPTAVASGLVPYAIAADHAGDLYVLDGEQGLLEFPTGGGPQVTVAVRSQVAVENGLAVDELGDLFLSDYNLGEVVEFQTKSVNFGSGYLCPVTGSPSPTCGQSMTLTYSASSSGGFYESVPTIQGTSYLDYKPT